MSISIGKFLLESKDPVKLFHLLTFILELESPQKTDDDEIIFSFEGMVFEIKKVNKLSSAKRNVILSVSSKEELATIAQKIEFFYYKENLKIKNPTTDENSITFKDTDSAQWMIELKLL